MTAVGFSSRALMPAADADGATPDVEEAVQRAQSGDLAAFGRLYREHVGRVYALCVRLSADRVLAEQLTPDAFVRAWERIRTFRVRALSSVGCDA